MLRLRAALILWLFLNTHTHNARAQVVSSDSTADHADEVYGSTETLKADGDAHEDDHEEEEEHDEEEHADWWEQTYERDFTESLMLIVLLVNVLAFDLVHHRLEHSGDNSYRYGDYQSKADSHGFKDYHGNVRHAQLWRELVHRLGAEFMSLGWLAFVIFILHHAHGFEWLADHVTSEDFVIPETEEDWVEEAEFVHMQLFVGMLLYFLLMCALVSGSVAQIRQWEGLCLQRRTLVGEQMIPDDDAPSSAALQDFCAWRRYFLERVQHWKTNRPKLFEELAAHLGMSPDSDGLHRALDARLDFSHYLSVNLEVAVLEAVEVNPITWVCLLIIFGIMSLMHRYWHWELYSLTPFFIGGIVANIATMLLLMRRAKKQFVKFLARQEVDLNVSEGEEDTRELKHPPSVHVSHRVHQRFSTEILWMRILQVSLFNLCYVFSRILWAWDVWQEETQNVILFCCVTVFVFLMIASFLRWQVPFFFGVFCMPPYDDPENIKVFFAVLRDHELSQAEIRATPTVLLRPSGMHSRRTTVFRELQKMKKASLHQGGRVSV
uniref:MLO-like protein n=1 Tax=Noctiluca scintillans TaxID=2966 RepID=A0A7S1AFI5_NOCSC|mmetsp:Transcript_43333/g.114056  ORF Transcript_43333/g.114056 Transcript_43333/m.114056 type:complete len:550 (+) Transcript_43333:65-1714(+)